jgi:hypothetical protein
MTANDLTKLVRELLGYHAHTVWRGNAGYVKSNVKLAPKGTPDLIGYGPNGRFVGFEIKVGRDAVRESQAEWMRDASDKGVFCRVIRSLEDIEEALVEFDYYKDGGW